MSAQLTRNVGKCKLNPRYDFCDWAGMFQSMLGLQLCFMWMCLYMIWGAPPSGSHCYSGGREEWNSSRQPGGPWTDSRTSNPRQSPSLLSAAEHPQLLTGRCFPCGLKLGRWAPELISGVLAWAFSPMRICPPSLHKWFEGHGVWNGDGMLKAKFKEDSCNLV